MSTHTHTHKYNLFAEHISFAQIRIKFLNQQRQNQFLCIKLRFLKINIEVIKETYWIICHRTTAINHPEHLKDGKAKKLD